MKTAILFALVTLLVGGTSAQFIDHTDVPLSTAARMVEIDYADDGNLVVAYVEPDVRQDKICVMTRDPQRTWSTLYHGVLGNLDHIVHLDMDTADFAGTRGEKRVFIGVSASWNGRSSTLSFYGLLSGRYDQPWSGAKCRPVTSPWGDYTANWGSIRQSVSVIPQGNDYIVASAITHDYRYWGQTVQMYYSLDHGDSLTDTVMIAGPKGEAIHKEQDGKFGHPSLTFNEAWQTTVIAFHDRSTGQVHIAEADTARHVSGQAGMQIAQSFGSSSRKRHHPHISIHSRGEINMTALMGDPNRWGAYGLTMFHGLTNGMMQELVNRNGGPYLHDNAVTPAEIQVRRSDAFIAALCVVDPMPNRPGVAVMAWQADRDGFGELQMEQVNDYVVQSGPEASAPRVHRTPGGFTHTALVAYAESNARGAQVAFDPQQ